MTNDATINIRPMRPEEKKAIYGLFCQSFTAFLRLFFTWGQHVLVAERGEELLGAAILGVFPISNGRTGGILYWLFTGPRARGVGAGQRLVEAALAYFDAQGCTDQFAAVEGFNTSSSKNFEARGFSILSLSEQWRRFGWGLFSVWNHTGHIMDIGHFLWSKPAANQPANPWLAWWSMAAMNVALVWIALVRQRGLAALTPALLLGGAAGALAFLAARGAGMAWAARRQGLAVEYRLWDTNFLLGVGIAAVLGGVFPNPGSFYPSQRGWRYRDELPRLARMALAGIWPVLALGFAMRALLAWGGLPTAWAPGAWAALQFGMMLAIFDGIFAFFPFVGFNSRRLWDWNRLIWALTAGAAALLLWWA